MANMIEITEFEEPELDIYARIRIIVESRARYVKLLFITGKNCIAVAVSLLIA
ncbi:MAG: hypothetical protein SOT28_07880 [Fusicatenibacter sp.]|nr:hypothetical protein [Lachnospiraceae bacterium]MDY2938210.1 hypothetical protein [Fusicatenibacter sp.]